MKPILFALGLATALSPSAGPVPAAFAAPADADFRIPLPAGETSLNDLGAYRVFWQSYGQAAVEMPPAWSGHFDDYCGISYQDWGRVSGRRALLMHSPWRNVGPGKVWVDYTLDLPRTTPIRLAFGIAMGPDVATPDKSDGVTFSADLTADGQTRELMRRHHDTAAWLDYAFDLSPHAGQTVRLRLQVEPGPKNNASWDYSFFGDAKITVGDRTNSRPERLRQLLTSRAAKATRKTSLRALTNSPTNGVTPSNLLPGRNTLQSSGNGWQFRYAGDDCRLSYFYQPATGALDDFTVQVDGTRPFQPARGGGATAVAKQGRKDIPLRGGRAVDVRQQRDALEVLWEYPLEGQTVHVAWTFRLVGKALAVSARSDEAVIGRFSLGEPGLVALRQQVPVPYLLGLAAYLPAQNVFVCRYLDWTVSQSSTCPQGVATYEPKTDGTRNPLTESGYIAVSPDVREVLPNIPHPPSPFLGVLGPRLMLDIWGHHRGTYASDAEAMRTLKDHGVDHLAIIQHDWQRFGYDVKLPDHIPANPAYGGDDGMAVFGRAANECGYLWSVHENYIDLYPDAPSYDPAARVLLADGSPSKAWYNPGTKVQSFGLKCNRALGFAKQNAPEIHRRYATTAAYLDVHSCVPPWHQLDHEAGQPMAAMALAKVRSDTELFQFMRDTHRGPLFGEGANHFFWAGRCDGTEAQVQGGEDHTPFLDFDLLKIHPQMINHGLGYYERWFRRGYNHRWGHDTGSMEQIDKYRAQTLAYGHAGFISTPQVWNPQWVLREHHLVHPVQRLYGTAKPVEILYEVEGQLVPASVALVLGDTWRQRIRYDSGLTLWVNWRAEPWRVQPPRNSELGTRNPELMLPQWGFLALGPKTAVCTQIKDGRYADYAECPEFVFADARTHFDMPYRRPGRNIEPRLKSFQYLGGNRAQVTYEWIVNDTLDDDYHCFVHGVRPGDSENQGIEFQQDHGLPKPTRQWRAGDVLVDGPHELRVSSGHDAYDLTIGLFKGERVPLKGPQDDQRRVVVARLRLERSGGQITNVVATPPPASYRPDNARETDFAARLNPPGTWTDVGKVSTDGSVKINREPDRLVLFPYPRERPVRVSLDLKALAPAAKPARLQVRALASGTQQDLGAVPFEVRKGRLQLTCAVPGAGRYLVTWP